MVFGSHRCITNIIWSKDFNIVQGVREGNLFMGICIVGLPQFPRKKVEQREVSRTLLTRILVSADLLRNNIVEVASPISLVVS